MKLNNAALTNLPEGIEGPRYDRAALTAVRDRCAGRGTPLRAAFHVAGAGTLEPVAATG